MLKNPLCKSNDYTKGACTRPVRVRQIGSKGSPICTSESLGSGDRERSEKNRGRGCFMEGQANWKNSGCSKAPNNDLGSIIILWCIIRKRGPPCQGNSRAFFIPRAVCPILSASSCHVPERRARELDRFLLFSIIKSIGWESWTLRRTREKAREGSR